MEEQTPVLRKNPHIYQINLMTWLHELSEREGMPITLNSIPRGEWRRLKALGMDLIWLMGMWQRSPDSVNKAANEPQLVKACRDILKDFDIQDITGSPYAVYDYIPDPGFGSGEDLLILKKALADEGMFLILDFVPNHTACDHRWIETAPMRYVQGRYGSGGQCQEGFFPALTTSGKRCIAHGRDPYYSPWIDTAQLNYGEPETTKAMADIVSALGEYCHGLRCDMAMLMLREIFHKTWGPFLKDAQQMDEFWPDTVRRFKNSPDLRLLIAEVYWGKGPQLLGMGFDFVYDKDFYDLMQKGDIQGLKTVLSESVEIQEKMLRFLENHDESRAIEAFGRDRLKSAMVLHATVPGMKLWQHGQMGGCRVKTPVQLRRSPLEDTDQDLLAFAETLLHEVNHPAFHEGGWEVCATTGWKDNASHKNLLAWYWRLGEERRLVVINFSNFPAQGYVKLPAECVVGAEYLHLNDPLKAEAYIRSASDLDQSRLYVGLDRADFHFFRLKKG